MMTDGGSHFRNGNCHRRTKRTTFCLHFLVLLEDVIRSHVYLKRVRSTRLTGIAHRMSSLDVFPICELHREFSSYYNL